MSGDTVRPSLTEHSLAAVKWNYLGTGGRILAQFASQILLARLLGPEPFGLFGYALLMVSATALVTDMGLSAALVQAARLGREQLAAAFTRLLLAALAASAALFLLADWLAETAFQAPEAAPVLRAIAPTFVVSALSAPAAALLRRELRFRALNLIGLASYAFGYLLVGVGVALAGGGVWALLTAWFAQNLSACIAMNRAARGGLVLGNPADTRGLGGFGGVIMVTYLVNWVIDNATHFMVGRIHGPSALGALTVANNLVRTPASHLANSLQTVLFPASARAQDNPEALRRAYLTCVAGVALVSIPLFAAIAATAPLVMAALLGGKWAEAVPLLPPIALAMIPHSVMAIAGPILGGKGEPMAELKTQAPTAALLLLALYLASDYSLATLAWVLCGVFMFRCLVMSWMAMYRLRISLAEVAHALRGGAFLGSVSAFVAGGLDQILMLDSIAVPAWPRLAVVMAATLASCGGLLLVLPQLCLSRQLEWLGGRLLADSLARHPIPGAGRLRSRLAEAQSA